MVQIISCSISLPVEEAPPSINSLHAIHIFLCLYNIIQMYQLSVTCYYPCILVFVCIVNIFDL